MRWYPSLLLCYIDSMFPLGYYSILSEPHSLRRGVELELAPVGRPPEEGGFFLFPGGEELELRRGGQLRFKGGRGPSPLKGRYLFPRGRGVSQGKQAFILWKHRIDLEGAGRIGLRDLPEISSPSRLAFLKADRGGIIQSQEPFLQLPGQLYRVSCGKGEGEFLLLMAEGWTREELGKMKGRLRRISSFPGEKAAYSMNLRVRGRICLPREDYAFEGARRLGHWYLMDKIYHKAVGTLRKRSSSEEGLAFGELPELLKLPEELCRVLIRDQGEALFQRGGYLYSQVEDHHTCLSPMSRCWLGELEERGTEGYFLKEIPLPGRRLEALAHRGLVRVVGAKVWAERAFQALATEFLEEVSEEGPFTLPDVLGFQGMGREQLLQFLGALEEDGLLIQDKGKRRVVDQRAQ